MLSFCVPITLNSIFESLNAFDEVKKRERCGRYLHLLEGSSPARSTSRARLIRYTRTKLSREQPKTGQYVRFLNSSNVAFGYFVQIPNSGDYKRAR